VFVLSEKTVVSVFLDKLKELGWSESSFCPRLVRGSVFIVDDFRESFKRLNERVLRAEGLGDKLDVIFDKVRELLERAEPHELLEYLKVGVNVKEGKKSVKVKLIDYENVDNNKYIVCREVELYGEHMNIRPDTVLYVNGIPLVVVEVKDPLRLGEKAIDEGVNQLYRYEREAPWLFKYVQIGIVYTDDESSVYMPMMRDWRGRERLYSRWRDENGNYNILDLLRKDRILDILRWFTFYKGVNKKDKIIPRYNQYWATVKAMHRIEAYLNGQDYRNRGLIWQWQGSGKTYIMFYIAYQFYNRFIDRDPIVFFIVDRRDLQRQLYEEFIKDVYAPGFQENIKIVESIEELKSILSEIKRCESNNLTISRGVYIALIQKFRPDEFKDIEPIKKKEILLLLDEAHRSQYGELGATINMVLPTAIRLAFTGTPVMNYERNTFEHFAYVKQGELYLDKYFISDSIKDGYTVPLKYQVVQEMGIRINVTPEEIKEEIKELLDTWAKAASSIGSIDDIAEKEEEEPFIVTRKEIRKRLNKIKIFLENPQRLKAIAEYIAERIKEDTEDFRFKAMVVVASRLACVRMKRALDEALVKRYGEEAKKWSEVVMTYTNNDVEEIREHLEELLSRWRGSGGYAVKDWSEVNRVIQDSFKEKEDPRILIVTDMLITGFDCPKLKVMYLDKPLFEHRLLQAIARVNRPYKTRDVVKEFGLIVDFIGLLDQVKEVIKKYELLDVDTYKKIYEESIHSVRSGVNELEILINDVKQLLRKGINIGIHKAELNLDQIKSMLSEGKEEDAFQQLENIARLLALGYENPEVLHLVTKMRRICSLYRALGAYPDKLRLREDVIVITKLYNAIMHKLRGYSLPKSFWDELLKMIYDKTIIPSIEQVGEIAIEPESLKEISSKLEAIDINTPQAKYIAAEALLYIRSLLEEEPANPVYKHVYDRLKSLEEEWMNRLDKQLIINIKNLVNELREYISRRAQMSLSEKLMYDIKEFLRRRYNVSSYKLELENLKNILTKVLDKYRSLTLSELYENDKRQIRTALLKDLFKLGLRREARQIVNELTEYIERMIINELHKHN
jgi:type I restriction enzyme R subunit